MICNIEILQKLFPSVLFSTNYRGIHLTFDDGPHPIATPQTLEILRKRDIHATFFLLGKNVERHPEIAQKINAEGHQIGNHSYSHNTMFFKKKSWVQKEIQQTEEILESTVGKHSCGFRPPYGYFDFTTLKVIAESGLKCILWSADSKDWKSGTSASIEHRVLRRMQNGSILLFHNNQHTEDRLHIYLPTILDTLLGNGFIFNTLPL